MRGVLPKHSESQTIGSSDIILQLVRILIGAKQLNLLSLNFAFPLQNNRTFCILNKQTTLNFHPTDKCTIDRLMTKTVSLHV
jgi:hypothetical protein